MCCAHIWEYSVIVLLHDDAAGLACGRRSRIRACEQLCAVSRTCGVYIWERHVLLLLHERRSRVQDACRRVRTHAYEQLCAVSLVCCVYTGGAACTATPLGAACAAPPSAATRPGTSCLSPYTYPRIRAAVCYLLDVMSTYAGAACAAAPPRRHHRVPFACRRVRIRACEPLCAVSIMRLVRRRVRIHACEQHDVLRTYLGAACVCCCSSMTAQSGAQGLLQGAGVVRCCRVEPN